MAQVRISRAALADFDEIMDYLDHVAGRVVADRYAAQFTAVFDMIAVHPGAGALRHKLGRDTRLLSVPPYAIYYDGQPKSDTAVVLRILRGRRKATRALLGEGLQE